MTEADWHNVGQPPVRHRGSWSAPGHDATSPVGIPLRGWRQVLWRVVNETGRDNIMVIAAGCAFYALLALFPFITALVSIYGLIADPDTVEQQMSSLQPFVPGDVFKIVQDQVHAVATADAAALGFSTVIALGLSLWSASAGVKSVFSALNVAYEQEETRSLISFNLIALLFTLLTIVAIVGGLLVIVGLPVLLSYLPLGQFGTWAVRIAGWTILLAFIVSGISLLYRYGPSRRSADWRWLTPGSVLATVLWVVASMGFSYYAAHFAGYNETYGALGGVIVTMMWLWITALVVLIGAELNAELELQTEVDTTAGRERSMGKRGAFVADHTADVRTSIGPNGEG